MIGKDRKKMFFKLVTRHSPTRWGIDVAEQPHCLLIYTVHTGAWEEHGHHYAWCLEASCSPLSIGSRDILEDVI